VLDESRELSSVVLNTVAAQRGNEDESVVPSTRIECALRPVGITCEGASEMRPSVPRAPLTGFPVRRGRQSGPSCRARRSTCYPGAARARSSARAESIERVTTETASTDAPHRETAGRCHAIGITIGATCTRGPGCSAPLSRCIDRSRYFRLRRSTRRQMLGLLAPALDSVAPIPIPMRLTTAAGAVTGQGHAEAPNDHTEISGEKGASRTALDDLARRPRPDRRAVSIS
jgi:hypothetical protein